MLGAASDKTSEEASSPCSSPTLSCFLVTLQNFLKPFLQNEYFNNLQSEQFKQ